MKYKVKYRDANGKFIKFISYDNIDKPWYDYRVSKEKQEFVRDLSRQFNMYNVRIRRCRKENLFI